MHQPGSLPSCPPTTASQSLSSCEQTHNITDYYGAPTRLSTFLSSHDSFTIPLVFQALYLPVLTRQLHNPSRLVNNK
ncbi:hypothetical protein J6590_044004 [Homalodisca vitripennis]|nr:hypothetical protein J6590_044004 [Homalodisca vitripennis]